MYKCIFLVAGWLLLYPFSSTAQDRWSSGRPDGHAPIGIMGDHYHGKGQWMFSYRYMTMHMKGNLSGSDDISDAGIYSNYMAAPQQMTMQMHMLGVMYAPCNAFTLMLMGNYLSNSMDLRTMAGVDFNTQSKGLGDLSLKGLIPVFNKHHQSLHGMVGVSIPAGSIDKRDNTPMMDNAKLGYPMQLGSGTWDPLVGATYLGQAALLSWGAQTQYRFRTGKNDNDYRLGNVFNLSAWGAVKACDYMSFSLRVQYDHTGGITGEDADMSKMMMPLFNAANSGREEMDAALGANFLIPHGNLKDLRLAVEYNLPAWQQVTGIQMKNKGMLTAGIQYTLSSK